MPLRCSPPEVLYTDQSIKSSLGIPGVQTIAHNATLRSPAAQGWSHLHRRQSTVICKGLVLQFVGCDMTNTAGSYLHGGPAVDVGDSRANST